jgi:hypothetical protein
MPWTSSRASGWTRTTSSNLRCSAAESLFCVFCRTNTMSNVTMEIAMFVILYPHGG